MAKGSKGEVRVVVGIDFGTTFSGFAYAHKQKPDEISGFYEWPGQQGKSYCKTQTGLFYVKKNKSSSSQPEYEVTDWGWPAQARQLKQGKGPAAGSEAGVHLTKFKLLLAPQKARDAALSRMLSGLQMGWTGGKGKHGLAEAEEEEARNKDEKYTSLELPKGLPVVRATADFLREISTFALEHVQDSWGKHITNRDVQWCLTVPAIWDDSAKQIMRRCAEMAGLVTGPSCPRHLANSASPHPVQIVLESEAASAYCAKTRSKQLNLTHGDQFMVADIGGGTTDIVVHTMAGDGTSKLKLKEAVQNSGDLCGGTHVDANFVHMLRARIGCFDEVVSQNPATITMLQRHWSDMKTSFDGSESWTTQSLDVPRALKKAWQSYNRKFGGTADTDFNYDEIELTLSDMKKIFDPVVDRIIELIQEAITPRLTLLLLVGGFSDSPYLRHRVKAALAGRLGDKIVMPPDPGSAVCKGAVLFGFSPDLVTSRVARKTYGVELLMDFDYELDPPSYKTWNHNTCQCKNRFEAFVRRGQHVGVDECFSVSSCPSHEGQRISKFCIYSTDAVEVRYTTDPGVVLEGEFEIDISDDPENLGLKRSITTSMFFGRSCIRVYAKRENFGDTEETVDMASTLEL